MSDTSRGRVTITLGCSGQVVKRDLSAADASFSSSLPTAGTKRSIRDRIGNNADSSLWHGNGFSSNKRNFMHGAAYRSFVLLTENSLTANNVVHIYCRQRGDTIMRSGLDGRIGKDDLRLKLMRKSASRQAESNGDRKRHVDLREKLSKTVQPPMTSINLKQHLPEPRETRMLGQIPSARSSDDLMRMETMRRSYSPWTLDRRRQRSTDDFPSTSRGIFPQRNVEDLQRRPLNRTYDSVRTVPYVTRDVAETSRRPQSTSAASFMAHSTVSTMPPATAKPIAPQLGQLAPPRNAAQKTSYMENNQQTHQTVDGLLHSLGLGKYAIIFKAEEVLNLAVMLYIDMQVDMAALKQMGENDLKELGIPMGPRKKILLALLPRAKRQP
ncbi:SEC23-interacting protein [Senna tora]|uniref:SEC23-interacting protein n=1 Tax=Senna tora TaxID=362788 RepID=A0A834TW07_9FABA|nr:SEC23-interacting protein [Senna tora]